MATNRLINEWNDAAGGFLRSANWVDPLGGLASLQAAWEATSNDALTYSTAGAPRAASNVATSALYYLTTDTAVLTFATAVAGTTISLIIPGPKSALFKADGVTIDPAAPLVAALITAAIGTLSTVAGSNAVSFIQGVRSSRRTEQNAPPG